MKKKHIAKLEEFYRNLLNRICEDISVLSNKFNKRLFESQEIFIRNIGFITYFLENK